MTLEEIEKAMVTKQDLEVGLVKLEARFHKDLGDFKVDLMKTIWITQMSTIGLVLVGVGLLLHFHV
jgi:hypothetical protein